MGMILSYVPLCVGWLLAGWLLASSGRGQAVWQYIDSRIHRQAFRDWQEQQAVKLAKIIGNVASKFGIDCEVRVVGFDRIPFWRVSNLCWVAVTHHYNQHCHCEVVFTIDQDWTEAKIAAVLNGMMNGSKLAGDWNIHPYTGETLDHDNDGEEWKQR